jgi:gliding motility-associated lipoprotein GldH
MTETDNATEEKEASALKTEEKIRVATLLKKQSNNSFKLVYSKKSMHRLLQILMGLLCLTSIMSCTDSPITYIYEAVNAKGWKSNDTIFIHIPPQTTNKELKMQVGIRTTKEYPYKNLHLNTIVMRNNTHLEQAEFKMSIYDKEGKSYGRGFHFTETTSSDHFPLSLEADSIYTIAIVHKMKRSPIEGICNVGIILE